MGKCQLTREGVFFVIGVCVCVQVCCFYKGEIDENKAS